MKSDASRLLNYDGLFMTTVVVSAVEAVGQARWRHLVLAPLALQRLFELRSQLLEKVPKTVSDSYFP